MNEKKPSFNKSEGVLQKSKPTFKNTEHSMDSNSSHTEMYDIGGSKAEVVWLKTDVDEFYEENEETFQEDENEGPFVNEPDEIIGPHIVIPISTTQRLGSQPNQCSAQDSALEHLAENVDVPSGVKPVVIGFEQLSGHTQKELLNIVTHSLTNQPRNDPIKKQLITKCLQNHEKNKSMKPPGTTKQSGVLLKVQLPLGQNISQACRHKNLVIQSVTPGVVLKPADPLLQPPAKQCLPGSQDCGKEAVDQLGQKFRKILPKASPGHLSPCTASETEIYSPSRTENELATSVPEKQFSKGSPTVPSTTVQAPGKTELVKIGYRKNLQKILPKTPGCSSGHQLPSSSGSFTTSSPKEPEVLKQKKILRKVHHKVLGCSFGHQSNSSSETENYPDLKDPLAMESPTNPTTTLSTIGKPEEQSKRGQRICHKRQLNSDSEMEIDSPLKDVEEPSAKSFSKSILSSVLSTGVPAIPTTSSTIQKPVVNVKSRQALRKLLPKPSTSSELHCSAADATYDSSSNSMDELLSTPSSSTSPTPVKPESPCPSTEYDLSSNIEEDPPITLVPLSRLMPTCLTTNSGAKINTESVNIPSRQKLRKILPKPPVCSSGDQLPCSDSDTKNDLPSNVGDPEAISISESSLLSSLKSTIPIDPSTILGLNEKPEIPSTHDRLSPKIKVEPEIDINEAELVFLEDLVELKEVDCKEEKPVTFEDNNVEDSTMDVEGRIEMLGQEKSSILNSTGNKLPLDHTFKEDIGHHICNICSREFKFKTKLIIHKKKAHAPGRLTCSMCRQKFPHKLALNKHVSAAHRNFKCNCGAVFSSLRELNSLKRNAHVKIVCPYCSYKTYCKSNLNSHLMVHHTRVKPLTCTMCDYHCYHNHILDRHIFSKHSDQTEFACAYCKYRFIKRSHIKSHIARKHQIKLTNKFPIRARRLV